MPAHSSRQLAALKQFTFVSFQLHIHGTWFSGQSIKIDGIYEDKSSLSESSHHLKLVVRSPHFNETNIVAIYIFNDTGLVVDTRIQYGNDPYGLVLKHAHVNLDEQSVYGELKIRQKLYTISANLNNKISKRISIDLHIDGVRDIQIILRGHSTALRKETGIEIKWDANRDDTQKVMRPPHFVSIFDISFLIQNLFVSHFAVGAYS